MPPKARITRERILEAGLAVLRREGEAHLNVRRIAAELGCSTQPVMYHYTTVQTLWEDLYAAADALHTQYILTPDETLGNPMLAIGMQYIRFAREEGALFRFLFQSDRLGSRSLAQLTSDEALAPLLVPLCSSTGLSEARAREVFSALFLCVHGAACLLANNSLVYEEEEYVRLLTDTFRGLAGMPGKGGAHVPPAL